MTTPLHIILDPGHGMSNRRAGVFDPGAVSGNAREADIAMIWVNQLRSILMAARHAVTRTRVDHKDAAPIGRRAAIARQYNGDLMISIHCNAANGTAHGTETVYRGVGNKPMAARLNTAVCNALGTGSRGAKTELELGRGLNFKLAVMAFQPCFLIELGFIDHAEDLRKMTDPALRLAACNEIAEQIGNFQAIR